MIDIAALRLGSQRLVGDSLPSAVDVVRWFGAVQSQDYPGAKWALGQRSPGATDAELDRLFDTGTLLRTHVLRPTWHFLLPEDARWLLELTGPRVRAGLRGRLRQLELSDDDVSRAVTLLGEALTGGCHLTRRELGEVLRSAGIAPDGQRLPYLLLCAELDAVIISGPRRGKQFTWALFQERVPSSRRLEAEDAATELVCRYFRSHGPAQVQDYVWWSGLTVADARRGIAAAGPALDRITVGGRDYWLAADSTVTNVPGSDDVAHLLPNWDEYTVGYRDRLAALDPDQPVDASLLPFGSILANVVTIGGRVRGGWTRTVDRGRVRVEVRPHTRLSKMETYAVRQVADRYGRFLGQPVDVVTVSPEAATG
ncbi:MAG TPA: winged helix DNA-binding domain-containing protein [Candidatus Dormibacteraeota bacterium]|nr:winged helix DNA-binding domain-containing protein [Candidatus Dormibacteraeota bacterium]